MLSKILSLLESIFGGQDKPTPETHGGIPKADLPAAPVPPVVVFPTSPSTPPAAADPAVVRISSMWVAWRAGWHDWWRGDNGDQRDTTPSPARMQRILDGIEDMPPGAHLLLSVMVSPQNVSPVPLGKFVWHVEVLDEKGGLISHVKLLGPEKYEGDYEPYLKAVPRRWYNHETGEVSGWDVMLKLIPQEGDAAMPDKRLRWWVEYPEGGIESPRTEVSWRHYGGPKK